MTLRGRRIRRYAGVLAVVGLLFALPAIAAARPAPHDRSVGARALLARAIASARVSYSGYAQSTGNAAIPDVAELGILPSLLGDVTVLRVWWTSADQWRVDKLSNTDEDDTYAYRGGSWEWDSPTRTATAVTAVAPVRLLRPADLTPDQLGRRLAAVGIRAGVTATRDGARRIAGRTALGVRLTGGPGTTVSGIQLWIDADTGVPLADSITALGADRPVFASTYLSFSAHAPRTSTDTFVPPPDAAVQEVDDSALRGVLGRLQSVPPAGSVAGLPLLAGVVGQQGVAVYGRGLAELTAVALNRGDADRLASNIAGSARESDLDGGRLLTISTPLVNLALLDTFGFHVLVVGTVPAATLSRALADLRAAQPSRFGFAPGGPPATVGLLS